MKNSDFCNKASRMIGTSLELVEVGRDYFEIKTSNHWIDSQTIVPSDEFREWVGIYARRRLSKRVVFDNNNARFWFEEVS